MGMHDMYFFFFSSRRRHTRFDCDWSSDVCSSDLVASPIWGALADRYGRKPMLVRAMGGGAVITALLIVAPNVWVVLALRVLQGLVTGTVAPARALVAAITPSDELGYSMGLMEASGFLGGAAGPLVGGLLHDRACFP